MKTNKVIQNICIALACVLCAFTVGCGSESETEIILTKNFEPDEVFRIEDVSCFLPEIMVYLVNSENKYNEIFGEQIWSVPIGDSTVESEYKETILARIAQIKVMNKMAAENGLELDSEECSLSDTAADEYFASLSKQEVELMGVDVSLIRQLYREFALANKQYNSIISSIQPEISDDEARAVSVKTILVKTYSSTVDGEKIPYTQQQRQEAHDRILEARQKLYDGTDFDVVAADYNEDTESMYSFGRGVMPQVFEDTAFSLQNGEISDIIETEYGYHILMCNSTFDREETEANKAGIIKQRQQEYFNEVYAEYVQTLTANLNKTLWDSVSYHQTKGVTTTSFFDIYDRYFEK